MPGNVSVGVFAAASARDPSRRHAEHRHRGHADAERRRPAHGRRRHGAGYVPGDVDQDDRQDLFVGGMMPLQSRAAIGASPRPDELDRQQLVAWYARNRARSKQLFAMLAADASVMRVMASPS